MEKLKKKRTINRKAGSRDLSYVTMVSSPTKLNRESLLISLVTRSLRPVGATPGGVSGFFSQTWRTAITVAVAQCMNYECKRDFICRARHFSPAYD